MTKILIDRALVEEVIATIEDSGEMMLAAIVERQDQAVEALRAALAEPQEPVAWLRVIDEAMVTHHLGVADPGDDYETAKRKMHNLLCMAQDIGTYFAKQAEPVQEPVQEPWEHLKQYGYAPGSYMSRCHTCDKIASGVDKRAITCRPCAEVRHAALAEPVQDHFPDATKMVQEPFGYFRAESFGWTDCAATDEGAIPLYTAPPQSPVEPVQEPQGCDHCKHPLYAGIKCRVCGRVTEAAP